MYRTTYPDARPGEPPLIFDNEAQREQRLKSVGEAIGAAEASLPFCENPTATKAGIGKMQIEYQMAQDAPTLSELAGCIAAIAAYACSAR